MPTATVVDRAPGGGSDEVLPDACACGVDVRGLRLPGLAELTACPEGCVDGGVLASFLAAIDPAELMTDVEVLDLVTAWSRATSWSQARGLRAVAEFARRPESVPGSDPLVARARRHRLGSDARWHTEAELGAALSMSPAAAEHRLATACRSVEQFPATLRALEGGRVDAPRLEAMIAHAGGCQDAVAARVEAAVLAGGDHGSAAGFGREVRREAALLDPVGTSARAGERRSNRFVRVRPAETQDQMWLEAYLPAEDAAAVRAVIEAAAHTMRGRDGEDRSSDQLQASALVAPFWAALASGQLTTPEGPLPLASVRGSAAAVTMTVGADGVADLHGFGPISVSTAREVAARAMSGRRPVVRVVRGFDDEAARSMAEWTAEPGYRPSVELARLVRRRDRWCRFPGCSAPATGSDLDHTRPWPDGPTHPSNMAVLCRRHHRVKQTPGYTLEQIGDGRLRWTTPTGQIHITSPPE